MLGINCILNNRQIVDDIQTLMEYAVYFDFPRIGKKPSLSNVYNHMRKLGIEVDLQTVGHIYQNAFNLADPQYTDARTVNDAMGSTFRRIIEKQQARVRASEIGKDSPVTSTVAHLANLVQPDSRLNPTIQKIMQDRLKKAARRVLEVKGKLFQKQSMQEILQEALDVEKSQPFLRGFMENSRTLWAEFQKEISDVANEMAVNNAYGAAELQAWAGELQQASYDLFLSNREVQQILHQTLVDSGFSRVARVNGKDQMVIDWKKIQASDFKFDKLMEKELLKQGFTQAEATRIVPFFQNQYNQLIQQKITSGVQSISNGKASRTDVERLARLATLGGFQVAEKKELYNILGIDKLEQQKINNLENLMKDYNKMMQIGMADWSPTFIKTIERLVRNTVERTQEDHSTSLKTARAWQLYSQFNAAAVLVNMGNALVENTTSGFAEMINTAFAGRTQAITAMKSWATVFADVAAGGVRQGVEKSNIHDQSVNLTDRTSWEEAKKGKHKVGAILNIFERVTLSSFDASAKAFLWRSMEIQGIRNALMAQGLTRSEANLVMSEAYYGNKQEIERVATGMIQALNNAGIKTTAAKKARIMGELAAANLASEGQFFQDVITRLEAAGKLAKGKGSGINISKDILMAVREAADGAAARGLGHSGDTKMASWFDRKIIGNNRPTSKGTNLRKQAGSEIARTSLANVFRFRSGALKWAFLNFYKSSGLALATTLIYDLGIEKQHDLLRTSRLQERLNSLEAKKQAGLQKEYDTEYADFKEDLERAYAVRQRLTRSAIQPMLSYAIFNYVILPAMQSWMKDICDDNTDDCLKAKMEQIKEMGWDNVISKLFPIAAQNYMNSLVVHKPTSGDYYNYKPAENAPSSMADAYLQTVTNPLPALGVFAKNNIGQDPVYGPVANLADAIAKGRTEKAGVIVGQFMGRWLNIGGPLKMWDINGRYVNVLQGENNHLDKSDYQEQKPDNAWQAFAKENITNDMYKYYIKDIKD